MLSVRVHTGDSARAALASAGELAARMAYPSVFCSEEWLLTAASLEPDGALITLSVVQGDDVVALLPLVQRGNALGGRDLHMLGAEFYPDPLGLICAEEHLAVSIEALREFCMAGALAWDRLVLSWLLEGEAQRWDGAAERVSRAPYLSLPGSFDELLAVFKKKKRYNLNASVAKFVEAGGRLLRGGEDVDHLVLLERLFALHALRSVERGIDSSISSERVGRFHRHLLGACPSARLFGLEVGGDIIAVLYGFEFAGRFMYYQVAHDPASAALSPGSVLLYQVIRDCCERGLVEFNFLQGEEEYKWGWTKSSRDLYRVTMVNATLRARVLSLMERVIKALKARIKGIHVNH